MSLPDQSTSSPGQSPYTRVELEAHNVPQLRAIGKQIGLVILHRYRKAEIIDKILNATPPQGSVTPLDMSGGLSAGGSAGPSTSPSAGSLRVDPASTSNNDTWDLNTSTTASTDSSATDEAGPSRSGPGNTSGNSSSDFTDGSSSSTSANAGVTDSGAPSASASAAPDDGVERKSKSSKRSRSKSAESGRGSSRKQAKANNVAFQPANSSPPELAHSPTTQVPSSDPVELLTSPPHLLALPQGTQTAIDRFNYLKNVKKLIRPPPQFPQPDYDNFANPRTMSPGDIHKAAWSSSPARGQTSGSVDQSENAATSSKAASKTSARPIVPLAEQPESDSVTRSLNRCDHVQSLFLERLMSSQQSFSAFRTHTLDNHSAIPETLAFRGLHPSVFEEATKEAFAVALRFWIARLHTVIQTGIGDLSPWTLERWGLDISRWPRVKECHRITDDIYSITTTSFEQAERGVGPEDRYMILACNGEIIGNRHLEADNPKHSKTNQDKGHIEGCRFRDDWFAFVQAAKSDPSLQIHQSIRTENQEDYPEGFSKRWALTATKEKVDIAKRVVLSSCSMNCFSGELISAVQMEFESRGQSVTLHRPRKKESIDSVELFLAESLRVDSIHIDPEHHHALAIAQRSSGTADYVLRETGQVIGSEDGVTPWWSGILGCDEKGHEDDLRIENFWRVWNTRKMGLEQEKFDTSSEQGLPSTTIPEDTTPTMLDAGIHTMIGGSMTTTEEEMEAGSEKHQEERETDKGGEEEGDMRLEVGREEEWAIPSLSDGFSLDIRHHQ